jgi:hypothetical protein
VDRLAAIREMIGERLIPGLAHCAYRDGVPQPDDRPEWSAVGVAIEQVLATYVLAFYTAEVALEVRTEGRGIQVINGEYPIEVRVQGRLED